MRPITRPRIHSHRVAIPDTSSCCCCCCRRRLLNSAKCSHNHTNIHTLATVLPRMRAQKLLQTITAFGRDAIIAIRATVIHIKTGPIKHVVFFLENIE